MPNKLRLSSLTINGNEMAYLEMGSGPLFLCAHGFPDHAYSFEAQFSHFAEQGYHMVAPFMRGYGPPLTEENPGFSALETSADIEQLIQALSPTEKVVLLGHDWGASAAYGAALRIPGKIEKLITVSVPYGPSFNRALLTDPEQQRRSWYMFFFLSPLAEIAVAQENYAFIDRLWQEWSPDFDVSQKYLIRLKETFSQPHSLKNALSYYRHTFGNRSATDQQYRLNKKYGVDAIEIPTLYLHGQNDGCIHPNIAQNMASFFPQGLETHILPNSGHFLHMEQPETVNNLVQAFLNR
jgi:pimeloyl-ACP methyl ester carboxylesterase